MWTVAYANNYNDQKVEIWGRNPDCDSGSLPETLWNPGGLYVWQTAAESLELVSNSAADAAAGTGARTVMVTGLDSTYAHIQETVTMDGVTPVALVNSYLRVNSTIVVTAGSDGRNAGTITLRVPGPGATRDSISLIGTTGLSIGQTGRYTVPAGQILICTFCLTLAESASTNDAITSSILTRLNTVANSPWVAITVLGGSATGTSIHNLDMSARYLKFVEKTDIEFRALSCVGTNLVSQIRLSGFLLTVRP